MRQGINTSSGRYTGQADYSAFGQVIGGNNPGAFQSVYQWGAQSGYRMDGPSGSGGDAGLVKVGSRYYDPADGRFTSRDSDLKQFPYAYCSGDPVNKTDPSGHSVIFLGLAGSISLGPVRFSGSVGFAFELPFAGSDHFGFTPYASVGAGGGLGIGASYGPEIGAGYGDLSGFLGPSTNIGLAAGPHGGIGTIRNDSFQGGYLDLPAPSPFGGGFELGAHAGGSFTFGSTQFRLRTH